MTTGESQLIDSGRPADLPDCGHKDWTLGCERCFYEITALAKGEVQAEDARQVHEHTLNGGVLFGWHLLTILGDIELQLRDIADAALDLNKRNLATSLLRNVHNISAYVVSTCTDTHKMDAAINQAVVIATEMNKRMRQETEPVATSVSRIVLTDL